MVENGLFGKKTLNFQSFFRTFKSNFLVILNNKISVSLTIFVTSKTVTSCVQE